MPQIFTGVGQLVNAITTWLLGIIPATTILILMYHAWMKSMADGDTGEIAARNKAMKRTILWGCVAMSANAIFYFFKGYLVP